MIAAGSDKLYRRGITGWKSRLSSWCRAGYPGSTCSAAWGTGRTFPGGHLAAFTSRVGGNFWRGCGNPCTKPGACYRLAGGTGTGRRRDDQGIHTKINYRKYRRGKADGKKFGFVQSEGRASSAAHKRGLPALVLDADGLKLLAKIENWPKYLPKDSILTPHPGEMSILTGLR